MKTTMLKQLFLLLLVLVALAGRDVLAGSEVPADDGSVVDKAGHGIKKGGEAAGRGIEKGADATVKGVKKGGEWVGKGLQKAGEKVEKVFK